MLSLAQVKKEGIVMAQWWYVFRINMLLEGNIYKYKLIIKKAINTNQPTLRLWWTNQLFLNESLILGGLTYTKLFKLLLFRYLKCGKF